MLYSKKMLLGSYALIIGLGLASLFSGIHYYANIAGFISALGGMYVFFKDPQEDASEAELAEEKELKKKWYIVFATGILFSLILGSLWNTHMGNMAMN